MQTDTENTGTVDRTDEVHFTGDSGSPSDHPTEQPARLTFGGAGDGKYSGLRKLFLIILGGGI